MTMEDVAHICRQIVIASHLGRASHELLAMPERVVAVAVPHGISYTTILSAMPRSAACFWIGLISRC